MEKNLLTILSIVLLCCSCNPSKTTELIDTESVVVCVSGMATEEASKSGTTVSSYFSNLLTTEYWPARWTCGQWTETEGWMYIASDAAIFLSYLSIPIMLLFYIRRRKLDLKLKAIVALFGAFILLCGFTHLIDVVIFWEPVYRLSGFVKLLTGVVSLGTACVLGLVIPQALKFKSPDEVKISEEKLSHLKDLLHEMSDITMLGSWEVDIKSNKASWSDMVYDIHEVERGIEIKVEDGINYYHPDHREIISKAVKDAIAKNEGWDLELIIITKSNKEKWVRAIGQPVVVKGKLKKLRGLFQDIDQKKRNELKLEETSKNLEQLVEDRTSELRKANQELESFSYSVSHDLRAPLRAINGFAEALNQDCKDQLDDQASQFLERITANSTKMGQLIDDLLEFSRMNRKETNFREIDLQSMITKTVKEIFPDASKSIKINKLPTIVGDKEMLEQVFTNLLSNAVKYSSKVAKPAITVSAEENLNHHILTVADNGVGFDMQYADKLFGVFERLHRDSEFEGTGVGLALCQKIINAHQGEIWAESKLGEGSSFHLKLKKTS
ncbi:MAG: ATP-binding protein [Cyclobacteriaceae bacterium]